LPIIAMAVAVARSCDVVSDPLMSYATDSCRHRGGRRRPFMIVGAPLYGLFLLALTTPPFMVPSMLAVWFGVTYIAFFLTNTFSNIPYDAWGPELTENSDERARLFFLSGLFDGGGTLFAFALPFAGFKIAQMAGWTASICLEKEELVEQCASGFHCSDYLANGKGYEFVENATFTHSALKLFVNELTEYDCDLAEPNILAGSKLEETAIATFCHCMDVCASTCATTNRAYGYSLTGLIFAIWYIVTAYNCCHQVEERKPPPGGRPPSKPLVPSMLGTLKNPAFYCLLPAWACDAISGAIFLALCPYLVQYVLAPEYQTLEDSPFELDCKEGARGVYTSATYDRRCNSMNILGACVSAALVAAIMATPIWLWGVKRFGKVKMWLMWSVVMAATNLLFTFLGKSYLRSGVVVCMVNGLPLAAKFLADAVLADIIDYDEFLTGTRNEATYTMFKSFLPKVMAIPAAALPLSIMNVAGHIPAVNGRVQFQPGAVRWSIRIMAGVISGGLALVAFALKTRYPLKTNAIVEDISQGIAQHKAGLPAVDPLSGVEYSIIEFDESENLAGVWSLDHFLGTKIIEDIRDDPAAGLEALASRTTKHFIAAVIYLGTTVICLVASLKLLSNRKLSFVPTLMAVAMGVGFVLVGFTFYRRRAARALRDAPPPPELVLKVLQQRQALKALEDARVAMKDGGNEPPEAAMSDGSGDPYAQGPPRDS